LARIEAWQTTRARNAYTSVTQLKSSQPGFAGMVHEMADGLRYATARERAEADRRVLESIFLGRLGVATLRLGFRVAPRRMERLMAMASPVGLRFLVGALSRDGKRGNQLPECRFRREGGDSLCEDVCRRPTEAFCAEQGIPVQLKPSPDSLACTWTWGRG